MSKRNLSILLILAGLLILVLAACSTPAEEPQAPPPAPEQQQEEAAPAKEASSAEEAAPAEAAPELVGDSLRGGRLYDNWMEELGLDTPETLNPQWAKSSAGETSVEKSYRCVQCHGWDYNGDHGFPGILADAGKAPNEILAILKGSMNAEHDYSAYMDDQALTDLALFVSDEVFDTDTVLSLTGDAANGETVFGDNCSDCHGPQGLAINFHPDSEPEYPATIANEDPLELLGKLRFGQPGVPDMAVGLDIGLTDQEMADVIAFLKTMPEASPVTEGGRMYDNWVKALDVTAPERDMPLWATQDTNTRSGVDTWRCKECHGWDYKGADGVYATGSHATGFPGIFDAASMSTEEIVAWLDGTNNADHDFSSFFTADDMARMAAFIQEGMVEKSTYINDDKTVSGDAAHGQELYNSVCRICHGEDGTAIDFADGEEVEYVGTVAADNPWEFFNKASVGQPGEAMPAGLNLGWSLQDIADLLAFAQTLPGK